MGHFARDTPFRSLLRIRKYHRCMPVPSAQGHADHTTKVNLGMLCLQRILRPYTLMALQFQKKLPLVEYISYMESGLCFECTKEKDMDA